MAFEISHSLSDGAGVFPYIKSALYLYLCRKTGEALDPAGIRLPGDVIPESETGNPFAALDIDGAEPPLRFSQVICGITHRPFRYGYESALLRTLRLSRMTER